MHVDRHAIGVARGRGDEDVLHQPAVFFVTGLESRHGAEIDQLWIDGFAALEFLQEFDRPEPYPPVLDIDHRAVIGLEGIFGLEVDQLVGTDDLEIRAERQDLAVDLFALHRSARDRNDAADAVSGLAGGRHTGDLGGDGEDVLGVQLGSRHWAIIRAGSHSASMGKVMRMTSRTRSVSTNGMTPLKMVAKVTSFTTLLMTKTFMPTGGWINPSSTVITMMTPNQIGSKPSCVTTGKMIGTVRMIIAIASIRQPSTRYITMMTASTP